MNNDIMVSVAMITYNHGQYLKQALDSVLMQKIKFRFEIVIADDCSSDNTQEIIREYAEKYPEIINPILRTKNIGATRNSIDVKCRCKGKYIILLEGDDFYISDQKLQKQYDFLEEHEEFIACGHPIEIVDKQGQHLIYTLSDLKLNMAMGQWHYERYGTDMLHPNSIMYRNFFKGNREKYEELYTSNSMSVHSTILLLLLERSDIYVMDEYMSVWRMVKEEGAQNYTSMSTYKILDVYIEKLKQFYYLKNYFAKKLKKINFCKKKSIIYWEAKRALQKSNIDNKNYYIKEYKKYVSKKEKIGSYYYGLIETPAKGVVRCLKECIKNLWNKHRFS